MYEARHDPEELLEYAPGLRALAVRLVGADRADDVLQDTWVHALRKPPTKDRPPGPWLVRVLRNVAASSYRSLAARQDTEALAVDDRRDCEVPSPDVIQSELEAAELLVQAVQGLDEPQRTIVSLRYFRGRTSAQIGAALEMPAPTVRWNLQRALVELRARLSSRGGGLPGGWVAALMPLVRLPEVAGGPSAGPESAPSAGAAVAAPGGRTLLGAAPFASVIVCVVAAALAWSALDRAQDGGDGGAAIEVELTPDGALVSASGTLDGERRSQDRTPVGPRPRGTTSGAQHAATAAESSEAAPAAASTERERVTFALVARLVDDKGEPIVGGELSFRGDSHGQGVETFATSGSDGRVRLRIERGYDRSADEASGGLLVASAPGRGSVPLVLPLLSGVDLFLGDVVLPLEDRIVGRVVDEAGLPVANAHVSALPRVRWLEFAGERIWSPATPAAATTVTDAAGRFELASYVSPGTHLEAQTERHEPLCVPLSELRAARSDQTVELVLRTAETEAAFLRVRVVDASGDRVPGAMACLTRAGAPMVAFEADEQGEVEAALGALPSEVAPDGVEAWDAEGSFAVCRATSLALDGSWNTVTLEPARRLEVRVVGPAGDPVDGFDWLLEARSGVLREGAVDAGDVALVPDPGAEAQLTVFARNASPATVALQPWADDRLPQVVELRAAPTIAGQVLHEGRPVAGARIDLVPSALDAFAIEPGMGGATLGHPPQATETDGDGRFEVQRPANGVGYTISITAPELAPFVYRSPGFGDPKGLRRVELQRGGSLVGTLHVHGDDPAMGIDPRTVRWVVVAEHESGATRRGPVTFAPTPVMLPSLLQLPFELEGLDPGRWSVQAIVVRKRDGEQLAAIGGPIEVDVEIGLASWVTLGDEAR